jgi:3'(2'), 5'-bisphosphate nucleotidase
MQAAEMRDLAEALLSVTLKAARVQMGHFAAGVVEETKADLSPVTVADRESEEIILEGLARIAPGVPVISEEAAAEGQLPRIGETFFLVDPLDGTRSFLKGSPQFTINIALIIKRQPVFGLVYAPAMSDFFVTVAPDDARSAALAPAATMERLADCPLEPLRASIRDPNALRALVSETSTNGATRQFLNKYNVLNTRSFSSSVKFGLVARGEADVYPRTGETSEWDTAAGHAVLAAAGGMVVTLDGQPLTYGKPRFLNPGFVAWAGNPMPEPKDRP